MIRYLRLYAYFLRFSFSKAMEFRLDFFFRIGMDCLFYVVNIALFKILYLHTPVLGGFDVDQAMVFVAGFLFADAVHMTFFSNNLWFLPTMINRGDVDYYIVRPVWSLFFLSLRDFAANSFMNLVIAAGILAWALARYPGDLDPFNIVLYLLLLAVGNLLWSLIHVAFLIPTFWLHQVTGLREVLFNLNKYMERPHQIFGGWTQRVLTTVLPFALIVSYPTWMLFNGPDAGMLVNIAVVTAGMFAFVVWFWERGLRAYSSASS